MAVPSKLTGELACILEDCGPPDSQSPEALAELIRHYQPTWDRIAVALAATPAEPQGTWSDGGKVWEGEPATPATDGEARERLDVIASWLMGEAFCADWHDDPDMGVRECMRIKALFIDRINEFVCDEIKRAAQPASPLRGRELLDAAQKVVMRYPYVTEKEALEIAKAVLALDQPASPLRGRGSLEPFAKELERQERVRSYRDGDCYLVDCRVTIGDLRRLVAASPAEQPAAAPSVAARMSILNDGPPGVVGKVDPSRSGPLTRPAADPVTGRDGLKAVYVKRWRTIFLVPEGIADDVRITLAMLSPKEATWHQEPSDDEKIDHAEQVLSTSGAQDKQTLKYGEPVWPGNENDDLDFEPIDGTKP